MTSFASSVTSTVTSTVSAPRGQRRRRVAVVRAAAPRDNVDAAEVYRQPRDGGDESIENNDRRTTRRDALFSGAAASIAAAALSASPLPAFAEFLLSAFGGHSRLSEGR